MRPLSSALPRLLNNACSVSASTAAGRFVDDYVRRPFAAGWCDDAIGFAKHRSHRAAGSSHSVDQPTEKLDPLAVLDVALTSRNALQRASVD